MRATRQQADLESHSRWFTEKSLEESLRAGECLVCSNLVHSERHAIHSFLWEGMMSPHVRSAFLKGGGFCARHFWIAKRIEEDGWRSGGIGVAILCENLIERAIAGLPRDADLGRREARTPFLRKRPVDVAPADSKCIFCHDWTEREQSLLQALEYLKNKPTWSGALERSPLCIHHTLLALQVWREPADRMQLRAALEVRLEELQTDLKEFIRKHDWNHRDEPFGREKDAVLRAIRILTGPERQFPTQKIGAEEGGNDGTR